MSETFRNRYAALVASGQIEADRAQAVLVAKLGQLEDRLAKHRLARKSSSLGWLFSRRETPGPMKGLYVWGDVGRGKTMLWTCSVRPARSGGSGGRTSTNSWLTCMTACARRGMR